MLLRSAVEKAGYKGDRARHGAITLSDEGVMDGCYKLEIMEMSVKAMLTARIVGTAQPLTEEQMSMAHDVMQATKY